MFIKHLDVWSEGYFVEVDSALHIGFVPVSSPEEKIVGRVRNDCLLQILKGDLFDSAVIVLVPLFVEGVLGECGIVAEAHVSEVIGDGIAVVDQALSFRSASHDVFAHVEALQGEVNLVVNLLAAASAREHGHVARASLLFLLESFEANNHDGRNFKELDFLGGLDVGLALVAVPHVVFIKDLWLFEFFEAIVDVHIHSLVLGSLIV